MGDSARRPFVTRSGVASVCAMPRLRSRLVALRWRKSVALAYSAYGTYFLPERSFRVATLSGAGPDCMKVEPSASSGGRQFGSRYDDSVWMMPVAEACTSAARPATVSCSRRRKSVLARSLVRGLPSSPSAAAPSSPSCAKLSIAAVLGRVARRHQACALAPPSSKASAGALSCRPSSCSALGSSPPSLRCRAPPDTPRMYSPRGGWEGVFCLPVPGRTGNSDVEDCTTSSKSGGQRRKGFLDSWLVPRTGRPYILPWVPGGGSVAARTAPRRASRGPGEGAVLGRVGPMLHFPDDGLRAVDCAGGRLRARMALSQPSRRR